MICRLNGIALIYSRWMLFSVLLEDDALLLRVLNTRRNNSGE